MISVEAVKFNVSIIRATPVNGKVYRVKDVFTTRDGSWEPSSIPGGIPQWARDTYLKPWGSPDYFDDAGADHHVLGGVYDEATKRMVKTAIIHYYTWTDNANHADMPVKEKSGWANIIAFNKFSPGSDMNPDTGERGAWAWYPRVPGVPADEVRGGGMPDGWHVSWFATWTLETDAVVEPPPTEDPRIAKLDTWARAWSTSHPGEPKYV